MSRDRAHWVLNLQSQGPDTGPWIVLSHALGCDLSMYDDVASDLSRDHKVLVYDHRDHGRSQHAGAAYSIEDLADDASDLIRSKCQGQPVVFVGVSMGGMTAQALAARHPSLIRGIVVANSAQHYGTEAKGLWQTRISAVREGGTAAISEAAMQRWFTTQFVMSHPATVSRARRVLEACDAQAYARACAAVAELDLRQSNAQVRCPALVVSGEYDQATPPAMSDEIAAALSASPSVERSSLPTGHLSAVEQPMAFAQKVRDFARSTKL